MALSRGDKLRAQSHLRVPEVARRAWRPAEPLPPEDAPAALSPLGEALLERQQADRLARAEARSLSPPFIAAVKAQLAAERAVEENLARARPRIRAQIRKATDPARFGRDRASVRFPAFGCLACAPLRMVGLTMAGLASPFALYFLLVGILLL